MSEFKQVMLSGWKKVTGFIKRFLVGISILAVLGTAGYFWVCNWTFSDGTRAGTLIKISRKGVMFKTYEGQLNLGGIQADNQSGLVGNIWNFSVWDNDVYHQLQQYEGKQVKLHYYQKYKAMPWQGDTNYFIEKVEVVK